MNTLQMEAPLTATTSAAVLTSTLSDGEIVRRVVAGEPALFEVLIRRHNQRVYRVARAVVRDEAEVEDIMQQAYMNAFAHLHQFAERSQFSTWLTRIALNEACARRRRHTAVAGARIVSHNEHEMDTLRTSQADPEHQAYANELRRVLEHAVDALPSVYRVVFVLRDIEGLTTDETGDSLGLGEEAVKTRLHRARAMIRRAVTAQIGVAAAGGFPFHLSRCDRVVAGVMRHVLSMI
jgi:RNA polymerase sigma-70 factor, ECF subfamily